jgi:hypothetical protein
MIIGLCFGKTMQHDYDRLLLNIYSKMNVFILMNTGIYYWIYGRGLKMLLGEQSVLLDSKLHDHYVILT